MPRAQQRPPGVKPPPSWANQPPAPKPEAVAYVLEDVAGKPDPVRFGDWEIKGIAVDF